MTLKEYLESYDEPLNEGIIDKIKNIFKKSEQVKKEEKKSEQVKKEEKKPEQTKKTFNIDEEPYYMSNKHPHFLGNIIKGRRKGKASEEIVKKLNSYVYKYYPDLEGITPIFYKLPNGWWDAIYFNKKTPHGVVLYLDDNAKIHQVDDYLPYLWTGNNKDNVPVIDKQDYIMKKERGIVK